MQTLRSRTTAVNGIEINYYRSGGDKPPLVIAHGVTDNGLSWSRFAQAMAHEFDVILYDARGHGQSEAPADGYTFEDHAQDLSELITALDLDCPHLLGHSGGAVAAAHVAASHPESVSTLILEDPAWGTSWGGWESTTRGLTEWFQNVKTMSHEALVATCREMNPGWPDQEIALWADSKRQVSPHVVQMFEQPEPSWRDIVGAIRCPILLIVGDPQLGAINTAQDLSDIASVWRQGRALAIDAAGHMVHYDQHEAFVTAVKKFLAEADLNSYDPN